MRILAVVLIALAIVVPMHHVTTTAACTPPGPIFGAVLGYDEAPTSATDRKDACQTFDRYQLAGAALQGLALGAAALVAWLLADDERRRA